MKRRIIACSVALGALALGTGALAQTGSAPGLRGLGFTLPETAAPATLSHPFSGLRAAAPESWWGLPGIGGPVQVGMSVAPRLGTGFPFQSLTPAEHAQDPVEIGPAVRWGSSAGTFSASFRFDPTGATQGDGVRLSFSRPLIAGQGFRLLAYVGAEWQSGRTAPIVPGLTDAGNVRPLFSAGSAANVGFGLDTHYQLTRSSAIVVGASGLRFGGAPVEGALYADRWQATLYGGYSFRF